MGNGFLLKQRVISLFENREFSSATLKM